MWRHSVRQRLRIIGPRLPARQRLRTIPLRHRTRLKHRIRQPLRVRRQRRIRPRVLLPLTRKKAISRLGWL